jgi:hypothetical protein
VRPERQKKTALSLETIGLTNGTAKLLQKLTDINVKKAKTYNSGDSLVVTDPTTNPPLTSLTMGEQTGSRIFW